MKVQVKKLNEDAVIPYRGSAQAAGYDIYAVNTEDFVVKKGETLMVKTGLAFVLPDGYFGGIFARSGLASKQGIRPANCVGVIDSDYRGELMVPLHNDTDKDQTLKAHERIAQLVILPYLAV